MTVVNRNQVEAEVARLLRERVARLRASLEALTEDLQEPLSLEGVLEEKPVAIPGGREDWTSLNQSVQSLALAQDQITLLNRLLEATRTYAGRACLFVVRDSQAQGWSSVGMEKLAGDDPAKGLSVSLDPESLLRQAVQEGRPVRTDSLVRGTGVLPEPADGIEAPRRALAIPLSVKGKVAAVLYADDAGEAPNTLDCPSLEVLGHVAALGANLLAVTRKASGSRPQARADVEVRVPSDAPENQPEPGHLLLGLDPIEDEFTEPTQVSVLPTIPADLPPEQHRLHEDARRFARLLVSELLLYNENVVIQGRKHQDIYTRLKEDIDRSWKTYEQRVSHEVSDRADYFRDELVRTLGGGDATTLGEQFPA